MRAGGDILRLDIMPGIFCASSPCEIGQEPASATEIGAETADFRVFFFRRMAALKNKLTNGLYDDYSLAVDLNRAILLETISRESRQR